ncbi:MAG TPA: redoxin domain-containing protein [Planctomycetota bacterium]|nr:redoxin domain-containing protein [Planctomycetota bacterium]
MLPTTSLAPPFTLPDQNGTLVSLAGLRGRWIVLYFYPKDDTPGCTIEACDFTASLPDFTDLNAEVLGCSADDAASHTAFINKHRLAIRLLTDADRSVMRAYGAYGKKLLYGKEVEGVIRSTVLIAPDGTVAHHWETVKAEGHAEQVRNKLEELQGAPGPVQNWLFDTPAATAAATKTPTKSAVAKKPAKVTTQKRAAAKKTAKKRAAKTPAKEAAARKSTAKKHVAKKTATRKPGKVTAKPAVRPKKSKA